ncbi:iron ABC transporter permease [Halovulum dunhuangense]|uniref:Iron ABC transporter permease n=1 Tax=Halovulum dunhuangense TaxID=1505036 RepID=A0A849L2N4_9RHOB|nr:iron ABC transporter permease [Halovulum dunhuangense]NNU80461.1 iron ABC transporter permease [Halovulum dunhuangense]
MAERLLRTLAYAVAALCLLPILAVVLAAATGSGDIWTSLAATVLPRYTWTTVQLVSLVALGTFVIGTSTAWLVTTCRFPGARLLEVMLALPLAFPAYVLAYAYTDLLDHPGAVQTWLRATFELGPRDYWFPEIRSLGGAAAMLTLVLYPYVYLLARAAFLQQSFGGYLAARVLGKGPWQAFLRVSLPMARPAIAGGVLLTVMETIADFGTVSYFGVQTFATGIYQAWFSMGDRAAAAQLALCLLSVALLLATLERIQRGAAKRYPQRTGAEMAPQVLRGARGWAAALWCLLPVLFGFLLPTVILAEMAMEAQQSLLSPRYQAFMRNSLTLGAVAAVVTVGAAVVLGTLARLHRTRTTRGLTLVAGLGYAVPGGVIAVGLMVPFAALDNGLDAWMRANFDISTGLLFTGSIWVLVMAYMVRFMAAALSAFDTGITAINPNIDAAARTLGQSPAGLMRRVHLPLMRTAVLTGLLIVFVDVMKELPATLIMRPFNFDTLAVQAHRLAADERLTEAALPSLVIMAFGLLPVILLIRAIARNGARSADMALPQPA